MGDKMNVFLKDGSVINNVWCKGYVCDYDKNKGLIMTTKDEINKNINREDLLLQFEGRVVRGFYVYNNEVLKVE